MNAPGGTEGNTGVDLATELLTGDDIFAFKSADEPPNRACEPAAPSAPSLPALRLQGESGCAAAFEKLERPASPPSLPDRQQHNFHVWRAGAVVKLKKRPPAPPSLPAQKQHSLPIWRAAAVGNLERPGVPPSLPDRKQHNFHVWRAAALAGSRLQADPPKFPRTPDEPESVGQLDSGVSDTAPSRKNDEHKLPAADLHDFDVACKRALKELVHEPDLHKPFLNENVDAAAVPLVRHRSWLKPAAYAAMVAIVAVMPWPVPFIPEIAPSLAQLSHLSNAARQLATMLGQSQPALSLQEVDPAIAAAQLPSLGESGQSSSVTSDTAAELGSLAGLTNSGRETEAQASQSTPDIGAVSPDPMAESRLVLTTPALPAIEVDAFYSPQDTEGIVVAPSALAAPEVPVRSSSDALSVGPRSVDTSMPRDSREPDPVDAPAQPPDQAVAKASVPEAIGVPLQIEPPETVKAERLLQRAERLIALRDLAGARLLLERATSLGNQRSVHLLAQTYDPHILLAWGIVGMKGDLIKAKELYDRAERGQFASTRPR